MAAVKMDLQKSESSAEIVLQKTPVKIVKENSNDIGGSISSLNEMDSDVDVDNTQEKKKSKGKQAVAGFTDENGVPIKLKNSLSTTQKTELQTRLVPVIEDLIRRFAKRNRVSTTSVWKNIGKQGRDLRKKNANAWNNFRRLEGPRLSNLGLTSQEVCNTLATRYRALTKEEREIYRFKDVESSDDSGEEIEVDYDSDIENKELNEIKSEIQDENQTSKSKPKNTVIGARTLSKLEKASVDVASYLHYLEEFFGIQSLAILSTTENLENQSDRKPIAVTIGGPLAHAFDDAHKGTLRNNWKNYVNNKKRKIAETSFPDEQ